MQKRVILVDSDVISHFIAAGKIDDLDKILAPHSLQIVKQVYEESIHHPFFEDREKEVNDWLKRCRIRVVDFPYSNWDIRTEYYRMKKENPRFGDGERACMAMAKFWKQTIASSNFRDVAEYCDINGIDYIGFMDILTIAVNKNYYTVEECNKIIHDVIIIDDGHLPVQDITQYVPKRDLTGYSK
ncbi:MAG: hypothetical protein ACOYJG_06845 [Prevotella sp.]|jgi:predicted nucleic acid-binding protein